MLDEQIEIVNIDDTPANRCSDFDEECVDVTNPSKCWVGGEYCDQADGYCPMMYNSTRT